MTTVQELQAQLDALRVQHASELRFAQEGLAKVQEDLNLMQADTDELEKEEERLRRQLDAGGKAAAPPSSGASGTDIVVQALRGLVDCDDSKCSSV